MTSAAPAVIASSPVVVAKAGAKEARLGALDGLRGVMAFWVLVGHACTQSGMALIPIIRSPRYAVDGFMVLSGFLMTYHYSLRARKEPWTRPATWLKFYVRRFFRISPLYYASLVPAYCLYNGYNTWTAAIRNHVGLPRLTPAAPVSLHHFLLHLTYMFGIWPAYHASLILPDWSLSLEMQFYLAFPFLMLMVLRFGWPTMTVFAAGIWLVASHLAFAHYFQQPSPLPLSLLWFLIGMTWAHAYLKDGKRKMYPGVLSGCGLALVSLDPHAVILIGFLAWVLFSDGWVSLGPSATLVRRALSSSVCRYMADASYSVYLTHLLILTPTSYFLITRTQAGSGVSFAVEVAVTGAVCYLAAKPLSLVENLGISFGRKLCGRIPQV
jgi:peptidoglycan/LPS O-acetylase OafA/YrhL